MHCHRFLQSPPTRRQMLRQCANGFGALALNALLADAAYGAKPNADPLAPRDPHYSPKAKNVIFLFMDGGPSQLDTFDPKPRLDREHGQPIKMKVPPTQFNNVGNVMKSPWKFKEYGKSGIPVSDLFAKTAEHVDEMCIIRSLTSNFSEHTNANYFIHSGHGQQGRPSMGSWVAYGLGSECRNLPGFVVLDSGLIPPGGLDCFNNGFLPATYQGSVFQHGANPVADLRPTEPRPDLQLRKLDLLQKLDQGALNRVGGDDRIESAIANYELAFRMQTAVPDLLNFDKETPATKALYGIDAPYHPTQIFARQCLLARRLIERGVRFIEVLCPSVGADRWDQHSNLRKGHEDNARATDQPIAGLLKDLKTRGLLKDTLVLWGGEFGRTPMAQGSDGRDHNPFGFTVWLAGGGIKGGTIYGQTDDYGYYVVENKVEMHDLHATMLHLLGLDHTKLTYRFGGRDMRLTDVHGEIIKPILA
ncbi:sulfatase [Planctomycetaceae bacterium SCGC AG-212-F19]|nr:sulfatase [Planctomycetaceae bacterium SCGC AG-212-F19]